MARGTVVCDTRQHAGKHEHKAEWWAAHGVPTVARKLDFGDYMAEGSNVSVDTKRSVDEVASNINGRDHARFIRECERAARAGCRLVVLVENGLGYSNMGDVARWVNGHCARCRLNAANGKGGGCMPLDPHGKCPRHGTRKPIQGARLYKAMGTIERRHGCRFEFCAPEEAARRICELLGVEYD